MGANDAKKNRDKQAKRKTRYKGKREGSGIGEYRAPKSAASAKVAADRPQKKPTLRGRVRRVRDKLTGGVTKVAIIIVAVATVISASAYAVYYVYSYLTDDDLDYELTGGIAATIEDVNILEDTITEDIMDVYESYDSEEEWATYLIEEDTTPEDYRADTIADYIDDIAITLAIKEYGIEVTAAEVEEAYQEDVEAYGDEDTLLLWMSYYGYEDEDSYRDAIQASLAEDKLIEQMAPTEDVADDAVLEVVNDDLDAYSGTKRSSHILISVDDTEDEDELAEALATAEEVIELLESGEMTFEEAAAEYSDDSSADDGGDVGWDCQSTFVDEYQEALDELEVDEYTTEPVLSDYGYHIILCTDEYVVDGDEETDVDNIPEDIYDEIVSDIQDEQVDADWEAWLEEYEATLDIEVFDMPEEVPYNVDLSEYETEEDSDSDEESEEEDDEDDDE